MARESKTKRLPWWMVLVLAVLGVAAVPVPVTMAARAVHRFVLTDPQFQLSRDRKDALAITGVHYTSHLKLLRVFSPDFGRSIFQIPLAARRRELLAIDWVEDASLSRVWPDRLLVRIQERRPVAFVNFPSGVLLIDRAGVLLDPPARSQFAFPVLKGIHFNSSAAERRERVRTFLRVEEDMGYLAKDISEMDVSDPENVRVVAQVENRAIELLLGDTNFAGRYQNFLNHYAEIEKHSPSVKVFDLRLDDRITAKE